MAPLTWFEETMFDLSELWNRIQKKLGDRWWMIILILVAWYFIEPPSKTKERMIDRRDRAAVIRSDLESKLNRRRTPKEKKVRPGKKGRNLAK
mmetsp:Transcript_13329/g.35781  ORF Transcript_13329/g.35781 Transcript_13329/m.35781 type:complete len:93 (+) Transcript_13329:142-420(+)